MTVFFFLIILASSGWLVTRAGGNSFMVEGMLILSAWFSGQFISYFPVIKTSSFLLFLPVVLCGATAGLLAWLLQGGKRTSAIRLLSFDIGVHCLILGSLFNDHKFITPFEYPILTVCCGILSPFVVYVLLAHSALGLKIRIGGTSSELMKRLAFPVGSIQAITFALAGVFAALAAVLKGLDPSILWGYGYWAYLLLWGIRRAVTFAGSLAEHNSAS